MQLLCYQIWGDDPTYIEGMRENVKAAQTYYPGWRVLIYKDEKLDFKTHGDVIVRNEPFKSHWESFFWRLHAFDDFKFTRISFRDADSRLNTREQSAVENWMGRADKASYVMHDHKHHAVTVMAGMWGIKGDVITQTIPCIRDDIAEWIKDKELGYGSDQLYIHQKFWPLMHQNGVVRYGTRVKYPNPKIDVGQHIGQKFVIDPHAHAKDHRSPS